jgi:hypothetical protein
METVPAEILKVQRFGRIARRCCVLLTGLIVIGTILVMVGAARGLNVNMGPYTVPQSQLSAAGQIYALLGFGLVLVIIFMGLWHLYALFGELAQGRIYTGENVRHIRQLGLLALASAVLNIILPIGSILLLQAGLVDEAVVTKQKILVVGSSNLPSFITASLILLASWIMEIGRKTTDEAERMRREAELVV